MKCRCQIINVMTGDAARDYANGHLDPELGDREHAASHYRCRQTGIGWIYEHTWQEGIPRLRRADARPLLEQLEV